MLSVDTTHKQKAYTYIRERLLEGVIRPGSQLSDLALAREMDISRTPVREAILQLQNEGFVEQIPRVGTFVKEHDIEEMVELHEIRAVLETHAVARATRRASRQHLLELENLCEQMRDVVHQARDYAGREIPEHLIRQGILLDVSFHLLILRIAGNRRILKIVSDMALLSHLCGRNRRNPYHPLFHTMAWTYRDHIRILRAIQRRDPRGARRASLQHHRSPREFEKHLWRVQADEALPNLPEDAWPKDVQRKIRLMERYEDTPRRGKRRQPNKLR